MPRKESQEIADALSFLFEKEDSSPSLPSTNLCEQYLTKGKQTVSKPLANRKHSVSKPLANRKQTVSNTVSDTVSTISYIMLTGLQKQICDEIFQNLVTHREKVTTIYTLGYWAELLQTTEKTAKNALHRLVRKGIVKRVSHKAGKGGWSTFGLSDIIYQEINRKQTVSNSLANRKHSVSDTVSKTVSNPSSSSSILTTTTSSGSQINIEPLSKIGFTRSHLDRIILKTELSADQIQESIHAFEFDLRRNNKKQYLKKPPLDFFMGIMLKNGPYLPPDNYNMPSSQSTLGRGVAISARATPQSAEPILSALEEKAFTKWHNALSEKEVAQILPSFIKGEPAIPFLKAYFKKMH